MAFNIPARYQEKRKHGLTMDKAKDIALKVILDLEWLEFGYLKDTKEYKVLDYRTRATTLLTLSERINIYIGATEILVRSECLFPGQFLDFGKNKKNIQKFYHLFDKEKIKQ